VHAAITQALRDEIEAFRLVYCCEDCAHFVPDGTCDLLYPTAPHRRAHNEALAPGDPVVFCKMFEAEFQSS
jgi:hypothetical protein